ncbi:hypothetical protein GOB57_21840 [Sinorhizobium meliloti]|nr:hypothetical protein [Sinorhizobium meliloti]
MRAERAKLSRSSPVAESIDYMLKRWGGFTAFLADGWLPSSPDGVEQVRRGEWTGRRFLTWVGDTPRLGRRLPPQEMAGPPALHLPPRTHSCDPRLPLHRP